MTPEMSPDKLVLLILDGAGGELRGKTLLQKRAYFLAAMANMDFGFRPHYYGPYSPEVERGLAQAKAQGFVEETVQSFGSHDQRGFETLRYDFALTDRGREVLKAYEREFPEPAASVRDRLLKVQGSDGSDYVRLSVAAKTDYLLKARDRPMAVQAIREKALELGWEIDDTDIDKAVSFLQAMGLAETVEDEKVS